MFASPPVGVSRPPRSRTRQAWKAVGFALIAGVLFFVGLTLAFVAAFLGPSQPMLTVVVLLAVATPAVRLHRTARAAVASLSHFDLVDRNSHPILYLRSFTADLQEIEIPTPNAANGTLRALYLVRQFISPVKLEELIVATLGTVAPVVALAGQTAEQYGAGRVYVEHEEWQVRVGKLMDRSLCAIFLAEGSESVAWEFQEAAKRLGPERIVICIGSFQWEDAVRRQLAESFFQSIAAHLPHGVPRISLSDALVVFDRNWSPMMIADDGTVHLPAEANDTVQSYSSRWRSYKPALLTLTRRLVALSGHDTRGATQDQGHSDHSDALQIWIQRVVYYIPILALVTFAFEILVYAVVELYFP